MLNLNKNSIEGFQLIKWEANFSTTLSNFREIEKKIYTTQSLSWCYSFPIYCNFFFDKIHDF